MNFPLNFTATKPTTVSEQAYHFPQSSVFLIHIKTCDLPTPETVLQFPFWFLGVKNLMDQYASNKTLVGSSRRSASENVHNSKMTNEM